MGNYTHERDGKHSCVPSSTQLVQISFQLETKRNNKKQKRSKLEPNKTLNSQKRTLLDATASNQPQAKRSEAE